MGVRNSSIGGWQQGRAGKSAKGKRKKSTIGLKTAQILPKALTVRENDRPWSADYLIKLIRKDFFKLQFAETTKGIKYSCFDASGLR